MQFWERVRWSFRRQYYQAKKVVLRAKIGNQWQEKDGFLERRYPDYESYLQHQETKLNALRARSIIRHDQRFHAALSQRLKALPIDFRGASVLCLAARQGSEVRAFIDQAAFAIGVDLNPGPKNKYVVVGDFHDLQFADSSVDWVYTNSLDHAFDIDRILDEVKRVLAKDGGFIVEADGRVGAASEGRYEALAWADADALLARICARGFRLEARQQIDTPWVGDQFLLRVQARHDA